MHKKIFANRYGLAITFVFLSLFPSTAAFAQKTTTMTAAAQGPQQVIVSNTTAQPVPMVGLVTVQHPQYYQATQTLWCTGESQIPYTFNVPSGKTLIIRSINVQVGSHGSGETFGIEMSADDGSTSHLTFSMQGVGGDLGFWASNWALNESVQTTVTQSANFVLWRSASSYAYGCKGTVTISGELM